jgi:hypothetical protein
VSGGDGFFRGRSKVVAATLAASVAVMIVGEPPSLAVDDAYTKEIEAYRHDREARLRGERGWLSLIGLFWLADGVQRFGSDPRADLVLAASSAPATAGTLTVKEGRVTIALFPGTTATVDGQPITTRELRPDDPGPADVVMLGSVSLQVIKRAGHLGIRLKDSNSPARRAFTGLRFFPIRPSYRVAARFVAHEHPVAITVPSAVGPAQTLQSPGAAVFTLEGRQYRLDAILEEPTATELFFIFRDQTSAHETYGAGRFLYTPLPRDGQVIVDFNKAFSPPCAFTPYATCPLPPPQNRLPIKIEAGELAPPIHDAAAP